jgi:large subunit ribosomal protein L22
MDTAIAKAKYIRISPFKVRRVANELVNKNVSIAESYLAVLTNKGALILKKVIHSARTNFMNNNSSYGEEDIYIKRIQVNSGPTLKRFHPIAKGRVQRILKRTCHILVEVAGKEGE